MSFMQLPFGQVEGTEAEQQGWEVQGGYPVVLSRQAAGCPQMAASTTNLFLEFSDSLSACVTFR